MTDIIIIVELLGTSNGGRTYTLELRVFPPRGTVFLRQTPHFSFISKRFHVFMGNKKRKKRSHSPKSPRTADAKLPRVNSANMNSPDGNALSPITLNAIMDTLASLGDKMDSNFKVPLTPKCFLNRNKTLFGVDYFGEKISAIGLFLDFL